MLPCPDKVLELGHGLLGVLSTTSIHVSVEHTSDLSNRFVVRTHGYPSTRSKIRAYARGLKPEETHRSRDWPTWVSCYMVSTTVALFAFRHTLSTRVLDPSAHIPASIGVSYSHSINGTPLEKTGGLAVDNLTYLYRPLTCCQRSFGDRNSPLTRQLP